MKIFKGTPGEWFVNKVSDKFIDARLENGKLQSVAWCGDVDVGDRMANVNLIAAAPDLLEALQEMTAIVKKNSYPQPDKPSSNYARAEWAESIISKALGEE